VLAVAVAVAASAPIGGSTASARAQEPATFSRDVAPILFSACVSCHRPSGSAQFSLLTYEDVRPRARQIAAVTRSRTMPPWKPESPPGTFAGERRLADAQIATIQRWVDGGAIEGDRADLPAAPAFSGRWQLGEPDVVLETPAYRLRATGDDIYRNFVVPIPGNAMRYIKAWEFLPESHAVHHATMQFDATGTSRGFDAGDPEPGYEGLVAHSATSPEGFFLDWGPGHTPYVAPDGMAWPVQPRTDLVMMLHLRPTGREEVVRGTLGLYFSDEPPSVVPALLRLTRQHLDIPAGDPRYVVTASFTLNAAVDVHTVQPHAHYLAREAKAVATLPDGSVKPLIVIRDWDFDWQGVFRYVTPLRLPAGTVLSMEYVYDNSAANRSNPHSPPRRVRYGQRTSDEMAELMLQVVPVNPADRPRLVRAAQDAMLREEVVGYETMIESEPRNVTLRNDIALLYVRAGNLDAAARHFAVVLEIEPQSPAAHYNLGNTRLMQHRLDEATRHFTDAVTLRPDYALGHDGLGLVQQLTARTLPDAIAHFERAVRLAPQHADIRHHLAITLRRAGRHSDALREYREILRIDPARPGLAAEIAATEEELARQK
jgi:thioredoxin-like negative regulator of GroEL